MLFIIVALKNSPYLFYMLFSIQIIMNCKLLYHQQIFFCINENTLLYFNFNFPVSTIASNC